MIKLSNFPFKTSKSDINASDNKSTSILLQAGFIRQTMAGVYTYTTLGLKVLRKIENIIREEMDNYGVSETLMPSLSPKEFWDKTGRWDGIDVMFHLPAADKKEYGLNSTHEEIVTPLMGEFINSYKDLPISVYQIQNKFRNEKRAKSGLLRGREFLMKDAYSFHSTNEDFLEYYEGMKKVYMRIFERLGLGKDTFIALADGGDFTEKFSHEFQVKTEIGEDVIYKCEKCGTCFNEEVVNSEDLDGDKFECLECKSGEFEKFKGSEIGNIFPLETKFSSAFGVKFSDENNKEQIPLMGCYGIGVSRAMGIVAEKNVTEKGINWPENIAPANYYIIVIGDDNLEKAEEIAKKLESEGKEIILDDRMGRKFGFGQKAGDCELMGIPNRIVVSPKTLELGGYELTRGGNSEIVKI